MGRDQRPACECDAEPGDSTCAARARPGSGGTWQVEKAMQAAVSMAALRAVGSIFRIVRIASELPWASPGPGSDSARPVPFANRTGRRPASLRRIRHPNQDAQNPARTGHAALSMAGWASPQSGPSALAWVLPPRPRLCGLTRSLGDRPARYGGAPPWRRPRLPWPPDPAATAQAPAAMAQGPSGHGAGPDRHGPGPGRHAALGPERRSPKRRLPKTGGTPPYPLNSSPKPAL